MEFSSYDLCIKSLDNLIEIACTKENNAEKIENSEENKKILNMISKIKEYIASKYSDSSITLSSIGSYVGVTPYYASRIFKEYEGINLADYISQYRINKAKEFLKENCNLSINQLCDMVGFGSERTFIRAFQKLEKITFGQYKKEHNMTVLQTSRYNEILDKRGAQGSLCGMDATFVKEVFEAIHEESVRQQMEIINK